MFIFNVHGHSLLFNVRSSFADSEHGAILHFYPLNPVRPLYQLRFHRKHHEHSTKIRTYSWFDPSELPYDSVLLRLWERVKFATEAVSSKSQKGCAHLCVLRSLHKTISYCVECYITCKIIATSKSLMMEKTNINKVYWSISVNLMLGSDLSPTGPKLWEQPSRESKSTMHTVAYEKY